MAKEKTNRMAWGLIVCLAVAILTGAGQLLYYSARVNDVRMIVLPVKQWRFSSEPFEIGGCFGAPVITLEEFVYLGPLEVSWDTYWGRARRQWRRVGSSPTTRAPARATASIRRGTGRS